MVRGHRRPASRQFFPRGVQATIRLDEIDWGGVVVNGIPPLEYPETLAAAEADYLDDDHIVFGIAVNGETRAYPKRILAWHEMALDRLGGLELTIVYCTLCGTVIPYESVVDGQHIKIGTSGFLYRSNKLMFDHETRSLWNTFEGVPVVGPLVGSGLRLRQPLGGDHHLGRMAADAPGDDGAFARDGPPARLFGGRGLPRLFLPRSPDVRGGADRRPPGQQGRGGGDAARRRGRIVATAGDRRRLSALTNRVFQT